MVRWLKANFPDTRILTLNPVDHTKLREADFDGPEEWLSIIADA